MNWDRFSELKEIICCLVKAKTWDRHNTDSLMHKNNNNN